MYRNIYHDGLCGQPFNYAPGFINAVPVSRVYLCISCYGQKSVCSPLNGDSASSLHLDCGNCYAGINFPPLFSPCLLFFSSFFKPPQIQSLFRLDPRPSQQISSACSSSFSCSLSSGSSLYYWTYLRVKPYRCRHQH